MTVTASELAAGELVEADYNPRTIEPAELNKLVRSIEEFGFVEPVVVRKQDRLVIGGHQRLAAFRKLHQDQGLAPEAIAKLKVPVMLVDVQDDAKVKALNLALNRISGEWDYTKLSAILSELSSSSVDVLLTGFDQKEVEDTIMLMGANPEELLPDFNGDPDALLTPTTRTFTFEVPVAEAEMCQAALARFGMTGDDDAAAAFVAALRAACSSSPSA